MNNWIKALTVLMIASGCSRHPSADNGFVSCTVEQRIDTQVGWYKGCPSDQIDEWVQSLLENELTPQAAIQIALLKNPRIQAIYEELGIAHADLVEAGLLSNPSFDIAIRYPQASGNVTNIEYFVTGAFLDIFMIPLRTRLASAEFEQTKVRVAHEILSVAFEVKGAYHALLGTSQTYHDATQPIAELLSIQEELVVRQSSVGNVNALELLSIQARSLEAKLAVAQEQTDIIRLKEKLNRLLGLCENVCLILPGIPQQPNNENLDLCALESIALNQRLDLQEARYEIIRLCRMLGIKQWWTYTNLRAGQAGERDADGLNTVGLGLAGEVPIFNYGQAARMKIIAQLRQAQDRYSELEIQVLSEVREAYKLVMSYLAMLDEYKSKLLPMQTDILKTSEDFYNVMGLGIDKLLNSKLMQLEIDRSYLQTIKDFWIAKIDLDKSLGGYYPRLIEGCE